jgi:hypothetical protein
MSQCVTAHVLRNTGRPNGPFYGPYEKVLIDVMASDNACARVDGALA